MICGCRLLWSFVLCCGFLHSNCCSFLFRFLSIRFCFLYLGGSFLSCFFFRSFLLSFWFRFCGFFFFDFNWSFFFCNFNCCLLQFWLTFSFLLFLISRFFSSSRSFFYFGFN